jgi:DNA mismatch endonuclease (patch repair protein)
MANKSPNFTNVIKVPRFNKESGFSTTKKRSALMSKIKGKHTSPELILRKELWRLGVRFRLNVKKLPGCPDIVITTKKIAIFIDGEFWHGFNWEEKKQKIKVNRGFWIPKIERNMQRDSENNILLQDLGFIVLRFWANEIKINLPACMEKVKSGLKRLDQH